MYKLLDQARVLITGASGLIGINLIKYIHKIAPTCQIIAFVHSLEKAKRVMLAKTILHIAQKNCCMLESRDRAMEGLSLFCPQCYFIEIS